MVDMHSHIIWNVDDGPNTIEQSIQMLEQAVKEGITKIIATPHSCHPQYDVNYETVKNKLEKLQQELDKMGIPLTLYSGHEVRLSEKMITHYNTKQIHALANSNYLLLELPSYTVPHYTTTIIHALLSEGITPIIAHPERNKAIIERPVYLERLIHAGAKAQITASSLAGYFGRKIQKFSLNLVKANLVHTYGSDVHHITMRPFLFQKGLHFLEKKKQFDAIDILLENNERIIKNKPFIHSEPFELNTGKWWVPK